MRGAIVLACVLGGCQFAPTGAASSDDAILPPRDGARADAAGGDAASADAAGADAPPMSVDAAPVDAAPIDAAPPDAPPPTARLVQQVTNTGPNGNLLTASLPASPASGDVLVMVGAAEHGFLTNVAGVTGGGVATWTRAARSNTNANIEIWYGVSDGSSAAVSIHFANTNTLPLWLTVTEWSGLATTTLFDGAVAASGSTSPASAGTITTTSARDLLIFGVADNSPNTFGPPTGGAWIALDGVAPQGVMQSEWYQVVSTVQIVKPTVTETAHQWDAAVAAFRLAP